MLSSGGRAAAAATGSTDEDNLLRCALRGTPGCRGGAGRHHIQRCALGDKWVPKPPKKEKPPKPPKVKLYIEDTTALHCVIVVLI